jgi:hypothetical protein
MRRRESLLLLGGCAAWCFSAGRVFAQQAAKVPHVGVLVSRRNPIRLPRRCSAACSDLVMRKAETSYLMFATRRDAAIGPLSSPPNWFEVMLP